MTKIFHLGMNKTGTTSLSQLLRRLGIKTKHHVSWAHASLELESDEELVDLISEFEAWTQDQQCDQKRIDKLFPGAKYIFLERPLRDWLRSRVKYFYTPKPGTAKSSKGSVRQYLMAERRQLQRLALLRYWLVTFKARNDEIANFMAKRPERCLSVSITCDPNWQDKVCSFVGRPAIEKRLHGRPSKPTACTAKFLEERLAEVDEVLAQEAACSCY